MKRPGRGNSYLKSFCVSPIPRGRGAQRQPGARARALGLYFNGFTPRARNIKFLEYRNLTASALDILSRARPEYCDRGPRDFGQMENYAGLSLATAVPYQF